MKKIIAYGVAALLLALSGNAFASSFPQCPHGQTVDAYLNNGCFTLDELCSPNFNEPCDQKLAILHANPEEYESYAQECASFGCSGYKLSSNTIAYVKTIS